MPPVPSAMPAVKDVMFGDLERELAVTRKVLAAVPSDRLDWKPHAKSMALGQLAIHVATLPEWLTQTLARDVLDFASAPRPPKSVADNAELLRLFDEHVTALGQAVANFDPAAWDAPWSLTNGAQVITTQPRSKVYRVWDLNHLIHHRGQLCVYLRLLDVRVPTVYFNTADDPAFIFD
jgi:uncharacterized damage-inducible protein DinB